MRAFEQRGRVLRWRRPRRSGPPACAWGTPSQVASGARTAVLHAPNGRWRASSVQDRAQADRTPCTALFKRGERWSI